MIRALVAALLITACLAVEAGSNDRVRWEGIERIVAIGDIHGDWAHYLATLRAAELVDEDGDWTGGGTHLVQTGDIPDRGPDTRKIIEHMAMLARQAHREGGRVHNLIGNHEAMNVYGDLRYVTDAEFAAFASPRSSEIRDRYFRVMMKKLKRRDPERYESLPEDFRARWYATHPPGWLEHRYAWSSAWGGDGDLFEWVMAARVAIQLDRTIFVHGGLSGFYCRDSLESLTDRAREELRTADPQALDLVDDPYGPLWYRGLSGVAPEAPREAVDALLERHGAGRIVVGHTPTGGVIWPRYDGRVLQIDTGISAAYGGHVGYLEIVGDGIFAGYRNGRVRLPEGRDDLGRYVREVSELHPGDEALRRRLSVLEEQALDARDALPTDAKSVTGAERDARVNEAVPICGSRR